MEERTVPSEKKRLFGADWIQIGLLALGVAIILAGSSLAQTAVFSLLRRAAPRLLENGGFVLIASSGCMYLIAMPVSLLAFGFCKKAAPEKKRMTLMAWIAVLGFSFALTFLGSLVGTVANLIFSALRGLPATNPVEEIVSGYPLWAAFVVVAECAPIMEELFFRKIVIDRLRPYGDLTAIIVSGILFGLVHGNFNQFFYAALLGMVFGTVYTQTGKLRYTVALHMVINFFGSVYSRVMLDRLRLILSEQRFGTTVREAVSTLTGVWMLWDYYLIVITAVIGIPFEILYLKKRIRLKKGTDRLTGKDAAATLLNPAVWCLAAVIVYRFFTL